MKLLPGQQQPEIKNTQYAEVRQITPIQEYVAILYRGRWILLAIITLVTTLVAVYTLRQQPVYESKAMLLIDVKGTDGAIQVFDNANPLTANKITNELEILKSNASAREVAEALIAKRTVDENSTSVLNIIRSGQEGAGDTAIASVTEVKNRLLNVVNFTPIRESDIISISVLSTDPKEASLIANVYTNVYTSKNLSNSRLRSQSRREFLQSQVQSKRTALDSTEGELQQYMRQSGVVSMDGEASKIVEQLSQLEVQRDGLEIDKSTRLKNLESLKRELGRQEPNVAKAMGESNDTYIRLLQEQLAKLEVQRDITIAQNPGMAAEQLYSDKLSEINGQIKEFKGRLTERTKNYLQSVLPGEQNATNGGSSFIGQLKQRIIEQQMELDGIDARVKALNAVIQDYSAKFNQIPKKNIDLAKLQRARLSSEKMFLLVEEKFNEAVITEKSEFGYVNVIDQAEVSTRQVSPNVPRNVAFGFIAGLVLAVGIVIVRAFMDGRIRSPEDLKRGGFIPLSSVSTMEGEVKKITRGLPGSKGNHEIDQHLIAHHRPMSPVSESYRHLRTNVQFLHIDTPLRCLVVTSANPKEGKTTTTCNLAISFSQSEKKVLLIDADLRRPRVHAIFGIPNSNGLFEYFYGGATLEQVIRKNVVPNLDIITCGMIRPNPSEILGSKRMKEFIAQMKEHYDLVIFDSPPVLAVTDAAILSREADGVVLVVAAGQTQKAGLDRASEFFTGIGVNVIGVVLNKFDARDAYGSYNQKYGYYGYESGYFGDDGTPKKKKKEFG